MTIYSASSWPTNAALIEDAATLGYIPGRVLDTTYGDGNFWANHRPQELVCCDLDPSRSQVGPVDFRHLPFKDRAFDTVVMDPPYRLNGTPDQGDFDSRYGIATYTRWQDRIQLILDGIPECTRVAEQFFLLKCQDQVCSAHKRWQTFDFTQRAIECGFKLEDRFDMLHTPRKQRSQTHSHSNYSTLLVFKRARKSK